MNDTSEIIDQDEGTIIENLCRCMAEFEGNDPDAFIYRLEHLASASGLAAKFKFSPADNEKMKIWFIYYPLAMVAYDFFYPERKKSDSKSS